MSESPESLLERHQLSLLLIAGLTVFGASRFDATRPIAGLLLVLGFPPLVALKASAPLWDSSLRSLVAVVAGLGVGAAELALGGALAPDSPALHWVPLGALRVAAVAAGLGAIGVQAAAASRGLRNFFGAWLGMLVVMTLYFPGHAQVGKDALDAFVAALLVSLFVGGGVGLALGGAATRLARRPPADG